MAEDEMLNLMFTQFREVVQTRLDRFEVTLRETTAELRSRDEAQAKNLDDLRMRQHEILSGFTVLSNAFQELKGDMSRRVSLLESQVKASFDSVMKTNERVSDLEARGTPSLEKHLHEYRNWEPWWRGWRWVSILAAGIAVTAVVVAVLWAVGQSGVLNP